MILNKNLIPITLLIWTIAITAVTATPEYEDGASSQTMDNTKNKTDLLQQPIEDNERPLEILNNMDIKTEASLKNVDVQNISNNQLSNEYISIENDDANSNEMGEEVAENTPSQNTEQSIKLITDDYDNYKTETPLSTNNRTGRLITRTTTTVPQYLQRHDDQQTVSTQKGINNVSSSGYVDDEIVEHSDKHVTRKPLLRNLESSSEENDEIAPFNMNYYDHMQPENSSSTRLVESVSSEDYYEDEYHDLGSTTTTSTTTIDAHTSDENIYDTLSTDFTASSRFSTSASTIISTLSPTRTTVAPTKHAFTTTSTVDIPIMGQIDPLLLTTLSPSPQPQPPPAPPSPQPQTQTMLGITTTSRNAGATAAVVPISDKKGKKIPIISTVPVLTTSTTSSSRRRLLPHEQLRNYIEDAYIRMPLAVIVDPSAESLEKTKILWNDAMHTNLNIKIVLVTLNESQEESPAAFNFNNTRQFLTGLNSIKKQKSGDTFRGISHAAELVPYDSAVFISTAQLAKHNDQVQDSAITLLKKRIRLYLIWFGERSLSENETQDSVGGILGEVAIRSGGEILHIVSRESSQELDGCTLTIVAYALRGSHEVDVPVDTTLSSLHVKIDKLMRRAVLETPNGDINLKKLVKFKNQTLTTFDDEEKRLDAYVPLTKLRKATIYKLIVTPEDLTTEYSVFIRAERKANTFRDDMIKQFETYLFEGYTSYPGRERNYKLGERNATPEDNNEPTHSKLQFPSEEAKPLPKNEVETFSAKEIHRNPINGEPTNISPLAITTLQPQQTNSNIFYRTNTKIEMGIQSQVLIAPGMAGQLYFEVTNTGYEANIYNIQVVDERRFLIRLTPLSLFLRPGQMATITVSIFVPQNTDGNTIDHVTFSAATSVTTTSLTVNLKVLNTFDTQDNISPSVSWIFGNRCEGVSRELSSCSERFWNIYIIAQDWQSGILRLQATPSFGLVYTKSYIVGTTEPLQANYIASCCETRVSLVAFDGAGNQRTYNIDVSDAFLTESDIAAIVLGSILLILLIVLLIAAIIWCCRRRRIVLDIPTYRSHSTRSME